MIFVVNEIVEVESSPEGSPKKKDNDESVKLQLVVDDLSNKDGPTITTMEEHIIDIETESTILDLNHCRIGKIEHLEPMVKLERLYLRWNLLKKIENLDSLDRLVEIELYDNQITEIENLDQLLNLE